MRLAAISLIATALSAAPRVAPGGVIKVLDSLGTHADIVVGTSIGSIIGALYASGYTGAEIDSLSSAFPIGGRGNLTARGNFDSLPVPFRAIAADLATRDLVILAVIDVAQPCGMPGAVYDVLIALVEKRTPPTPESKVPRCRP